MATIAFSKRMDYLPVNFQPFMGMANNLFALTRFAPSVMGSLLVKNPLFLKTDLTNRNCVIPDANPQANSSKTPVNKIDIGLECVSV